jgi:tetratricopeptide (TPR) repeat protein
VPGLQGQPKDALINKALGLLKIRKDKEALGIFENILAQQPDNLNALWGKAEFLRRNYQYKQAEDLLNRILKTNPKHLAALNSLAYIRYKEGNLEESQKITEQILKSRCLDKENEALAYLTLGAIANKRSAEGWLLTKIKSAIEIKSYFEKAAAVAPNLAETHLSLGSFYLKAPLIVGGNLDHAIKELELSIAIAPDFALANARLAQAYRKKGDLVKYNFYLKKTKELDPEDEGLKEIKD